MIKRLQDVVEITITLGSATLATAVVLWPWHMEAQAVLIGYHYRAAAP